MLWRVMLQERCQGVEYDTQVGVEGLPRLRCCCCLLPSWGPWRSGDEAEQSWQCVLPCPGGSGAVVVDLAGHASQQPHS